MTFSQHVGDLGNSVVADLADVQQTIFAGQQIDQCAEIQNLGDRAFVDLTDFNFCSDFADATLGLFGLCAIGGSNGDGAVFLDIDLATGFFG